MIQLKSAAKNSIVLIPAFTDTYFRHICENKTNKSSSGFSQKKHTNDLVESTVIVVANVIENNIIRLYFVSFFVNKSEKQHLI